MACNGVGTCYSVGGCFKHNEQQEDPNPKAAASSPIRRHALCTKCKSNQRIAATNPAVAADYGGDGVRFCAECFRSNIQWKFRFAVTSNGMISPSDNVLVAFSGGASSRVVLQLVHEMQYKAQKNYDASRDKTLPIFGVGVAIIDESALCPVASDEFEKAVEDIKLVLSDLSPPTKALHIVPIESIFASDESDRKEKLNMLKNVVTDATGKEDLLLYLRALLLQKIAAENGYTKLVLGTCTSRIACHVLAATVKGKGYSLAADIQYVDARSEIPVVLPLRDCLSQELEMLCCLDSLKTVELFGRPHSGINGLISSFVKLLQEENPSRESTIMRTAGKLTPFHFNKIPENEDLDSHLASERRQKKYNLKPNESLASESFCPICNSPLNKSNSINSSNNEEVQWTGQTFATMCCSSCQFQILPKESIEQLYSMLPHQVIVRAKDHNIAKQRLIREQIQDCLLLDSEDEALT